MILGVNQLHLSYLIIIKSLMPNVVAAIHHDVVSPDTRLPDWALSGHVWLCLIMLILAPLSFLKHLDSLRHTSFIALFAVGMRFDPQPLAHYADDLQQAYLVVVVVYGYFNPMDGAPEPGEIHLIHFTPTFVSTFPVQVFAFTCAQNVRPGHPSVGAFIYCVTKLFPIYNELNHNTQRRMNIVIGTSIGSAIGIYEIIGVFGYLTFGSKVRPNPLRSRPSPLHYGRLEPTLLRCTPLLRSSSLLDNWPSRSSSCSRTLCRYTHAAIALTRFFIWAARLRSLR